MSTPNLAENLRKAPEFHQENQLRAVGALEPALKHEDHEHPLGWIELARIGFVALAAAAIWFRIWEPFHRVSVVGVLAALIGGYPIFKEAWENIVERKMTMELSMTIALLAALAIGEFFTALVITAFVLAASDQHCRTRNPTRPYMVGTFPRGAEMGRNCSTKMSRRPMTPTQSRAASCLWCSAHV